MPRYDFKCDTCGHVIEVQLTAEKRDTVQICHGRMRRLVAIGMAHLWGMFGSRTMHSRAMKIEAGEW